MVCNPFLLKLIPEAPAAVEREGVSLFQSAVQITGSLKLTSLALTLNIVVFQSAVQITGSLKLSRPHALPTFAMRFNLPCRSLAP